MKLLAPLALMLICIFPNHGSAQYNNEPSAKHPFGQAHPDAPPEVKNFQPLIGLAKCKSTNRNADGTWNEELDMTWKFKYIMNGMAVQDETLKADGKHSGSIRQFNADSSKWFVHYYASKNVYASLPTWSGKGSDESIVLYREQKSPSGKNGNYLLTFYDINEKGYKWEGAWVSLDEKVVYPTWKISCEKKKD